MEYIFTPQPEKITQNLSQRPKRRTFCLVHQSLLFKECSAVSVPCFQTDQSGECRRNLEGISKSRAFLSGWAVDRKRCPYALHAGVLRPENPFFSCDTHRKA